MINKTIASILFFLITFVLAGPLCAQSSPGEIPDYKINNYVMFSDIDFVIKIERTDSESDIAKFKKVLQIMNIDAHIKYERNNQNEIKKLTYDDGNNVCGSDNFSTLQIIRQKQGKTSCGIKDFIPPKE